jgi:upstream activation factor subunit UAF30
MSRYFAMKNTNFFSERVVFRLESVFLSISMVATSKPTHCMLAAFHQPKGRLTMATDKKPTEKKAAPAKKAPAAKTAPAAKKAATKKTVASKTAATNTTASTAPEDNTSNGFMKKLTPSAALAAVIGAAPLPRTEVVKKLWVYIKENNLQDQANKRMIVANAQLKEVFGKAKVSMFEMAGLIGKHLK